MMRRVIFYLLLDDKLSSYTLISFVLQELPTTTTVLMDPKMQLKNRSSFPFLHFECEKLVKFKLPKFVRDSYSSKSASCTYKGGLLRISFAVFDFDTRDAFDFDGQTKGERKQTDSLRSRGKSFSCQRTDPFCRFSIM